MKPVSTLVACVEGDLAVCLDGATVWAPSGVKILREINWRVGRGERWALLGPNGSGKSTVLSLAGAVRHPSAGSVVVLGGMLGRVDMSALRRSIGFVDAGQASYGWMTAEESVLTGIGSTLRPIWGSYSAVDQERARGLLGLLGCGDLAERELGTLSQGERGRVRIARALIAEPQLLLLDEPAVGLDLAAREALIAALDRLSAERADLTIVLVTHHLEEIPRSMSHALLLREGAVVSSGPIHEALGSESLSACFGLPVECVRLGDRWSARAPAEWARAGVLV